MKKLEIMKIGSVTAKNGRVYNFTEFDGYSDESDRLN